MTLSLSDYRCKVGIAFFGGCGSNVLKQIIDGVDPADYPDFYLFGANTDAKVHQYHFAESEDGSVKRWLDAGALTIHQLGGSEVTRGRGAGANPDIGRKAAETKESQEAIRQFFETVDEVFLVGSAGGGTGAGALPVAAKIAKELKKSTLAFVVMPEPDEGNMKRAIEALGKVQDLVPTIPVRNGYLSEYLTNLSVEERRRLTFKEAWRIVDENSLVPMLRIIREIVQETGDIINFDQADWETLLSYGHSVSFGLSDIKPDEFEAMPAEKIVEELFTLRFQDPGAVNQGEVLGICAHGPWAFEKFNEVRRLAKARICAGTSERDIEVHSGIVQKVSDGKIWVAIIVVAKHRHSLAPVAEFAEEERFDLSAATTQLRFRSAGEMRVFFVPPDLATRFNRAYTGIQSTREEIERACREIEKRTGVMPDMPARFQPQVAEKKTSFRDLLAALLPRRLQTGGRS